MDDRDEDERRRTRDGAAPGSALGGDDTADGAPREDRAPAVSPGAHSAADGVTGGPATNVVPVDLRDYVDFSEEAARRVRVFATAHLAVDVWCIEPRQSTPVLHLTDRDVSYTVIGGRSWFVTDEGEIGLDPMGSMLVRAGTVHGIDNRAPDPLIVLAASSPPSAEPADLPVTTRRDAIRHPRGRSTLRTAWETVLGVRHDT